MKVYSLQQSSKALFSPLLPKAIKQQQQQLPNVVQNQKNKNKNK